MSKKDRLKAQKEKQDRLSRAASSLSFIANTSFENPQTMRGTGIVCCCYIQYTIGVIAWQQAVFYRFRTKSKNILPFRLVPPKLSTLARPSPRTVMRSPSAI